MNDSVKKKWWGHRCWNWKPANSDFSIKHGFYGYIFVKGFMAVVAPIVAPLIPGLQGLVNAIASWAGSLAQSVH